MLAGTEPAFQASPSAQPFKGDSRLRFFGLGGCNSSKHFGISGVSCSRSDHLFFPLPFSVSLAINGVASLSARLLYFFYYLVHYAWLQGLKQTGENPCIFLLGFLFHSKRGRSEIGSIGRIIFHCFISVGRINL